MSAHSKKVFLVVAVLSAIPLAVWAADVVQLPDGSKLDLSTSCPVCSMRIGGSELGYAAVVFKDGRVVGFDGPGDFFRYVLSPGKYGFDAANIKSSYVTDYGTRKLIDAKTALFVIGSNITGGMGPEAVPFGTKEAAEKFKSDRGGKAVVPYADVKLDDLKPKKTLLKMKRDPKHGH